MDDDWLDWLGTALVVIAMLGLAAFPIAMFFAAIFGGWV